MNYCYFCGKECVAAAIDSYNELCQNHLTTVLHFINNRSSLNELVCVHFTGWHRDDLYGVWLYLLYEPRTLIMRLEEGEDKGSIILHTLANLTPENLSEKLATILTFS
jgi:hypothetical protein